MKITQLFIDLSGVPIVDTIAAQQLFQLKEISSLIGIAIIKFQRISSAFRE
ncbi:hypothetical protein [Fictibacillus terranigra]|uniref:hypothetical protein n=1 Tax=Fictibacillus terranigra TaxID=3058424 RepID=UPI003CD0CD29